MDTMALTKTTSKGNQVVVRTDGVRCRVELDGRDLGTCGYPVKVRTSAGLVWILDVKPAIGLTDAERDAIEAAMSAAFAARPVSLAEQRAELVAKLADAYRQWQDAREAAFAADTGAGFPGTAEIEAAQAALDAFDAAHPEIAAEVKAAREAERAVNIRAAENA